MFYLALEIHTWLDFAQDNETQKYCDKYQCAKNDSQWFWSWRLLRLNSFIKFYKIIRLKFLSKQHSCMFHLFCLFILFILICTVCFYYCKFLKHFACVCNELCASASFLLTAGSEYIRHISWKHDTQYLLTTACCLSRDETKNVHNFMDYIYYLLFNYTHMFRLSRSSSGTPFWSYKLFL